MTRREQKPIIRETDFETVSQACAADHRTNTEELLTI